MEIRRYVAWGWARWVMSVCSTAFSAVVYALFWSAPEVTWAMRAAFALVPASVGGLWLRWYRVRKERADAVSFVTSQGISVITNGFPLEAASVSEDAENAILFWSRYYNEASIRDYMNGVAVIVHWLPLSDPRHGISGASGLTYGKEVHVSAGPSLGASLRHEFGHVCMLGGGVANDNVLQHRLMHDLGYPDA